MDSVQIGYDNVNDGVHVDIVVNLNSGGGRYLHMNYELF